MGTKHAEIGEIQILCRKEGRICVPGQARGPRFEDQSDLGEGDSATWYVARTNVLKPDGARRVRWDVVAVVTEDEN